MRALRRRSEHSQGWYWRLEGCIHLHSSKVAVCCLGGDGPNAARKCPGGGFTPNWAEWAEWAEQNGRNGRKEKMAGGLCWRIDCSLLVRPPTPPLPSLPPAARLHRSFLPFRGSQSNFPSFSCPIPSPSAHLPRTSRAPPFTPFTLFTPPPPHPLSLPIRTATRSPR